MTQPHRVQLKRTKGWCKPANTIVVARPSMWGNPFIVGEHYPAMDDSGVEEGRYRIQTAEEAVQAFRDWHEHSPGRQESRRPHPGRPGTQRHAAPPRTAEDCGMTDNQEARSGAAATGTKETTATPETITRIQIYRRILALTEDLPADPVGQALVCHLVDTIVRRSDSLNAALGRVNMVSAEMKHLLRTHWPEVERKRREGLL